MSAFKDMIKNIGGHIFNSITPFLHNDGIVFLTYHEISDYDSPLNLTIPLNQFCEQIEYLQKKFSVISFDEAIYMLEERRLRGLCFAITFDDGFKNNAIAFEFLKSLNIKPILFVSVNALERKEFFWFKKLEIALENKSKFLRHINKECLEDALFYLKSISKDKRNSILDDFLESTGGRRLFNLEDEVFSWENLQRLASDNQVIIGSHGMHHESLKSMNNEEILNELSLSKEIIKNRIGIDVDAYAFPNGSWDDIPKGIEDTLDECGYRYAFSLIQGVNETISFKMKRINITKNFYSQNSLFNENVILFNLYNTMGFLK